MEDKEEEVLLSNVDNNGKYDSMEDAQKGKEDPGKSNRQPDKGLYFNDGVRKIDFVLAFSDEDNEKVKLRNVFEKNLAAEGLQFESENKKTSKSTSFVKIHAPWDVLTRQAEKLKMKMPTKEPFRYTREPSCTERISRCFDLPHGIVPEDEDHFSALFQRARLNMFNIKDQATFFTSAQRSMLVHALLLRTHFDDDNAKRLFGINRLLNDGVYCAAYPLHEGISQPEKPLIPPEIINERHMLYEAWARPGHCLKRQPEDAIRKYFGEKIGIYFAWLGFYTGMLIPAAMVGVLVFIYGCLTVRYSIPSNEICDLSIAGNLTMCPLCDRRCTYWKLADSCIYSKLTSVVDNWATVGFSFFMSVWATLFLEFWKRHQAELEYDWDVEDYEAEEVYEPYVPLYSEIPRKLTSVVLILFMMFLIMVAVAGVVIYQIIILNVLYLSDNEVVRDYASLFAVATATLINLVIIIIMNSVYVRLAQWLTDLEMQRTDSNYENSYTLKLFSFQFVNSFSIIVYTAFIKGRLAGYPGKKFRIAGYAQESCHPAGCLIEVCIQAITMLVGIQAWNNFVEIVVPRVQNYCSTKDIKEDEKDRPQWEKDYSLVPQFKLGLFYEYLELAIQYGFVTLFVAVFPLAPLSALINNLMEIRIDAIKLVTQFRRPVAHRANNIGMWYNILWGVSVLAVLSNAFVIGWTSDFIPKIVYKLTLSQNATLHGYIDYRLSYFDVQDFEPESVPPLVDTAVFGTVTQCRYPDFRNPPDIAPPYEKYANSAEQWHVALARLAFVMVFVHAVFFVSWLVSYLVPDVSWEICQLRQWEIHLEREAHYGEDKKASA